MRFALIATSVAAAIVVPFAVAASGPQMSSEEFVTAVRCTAYEAVTHPEADLGAAKFQLNSEAQRQQPETAAQARAAAHAISREAVNIESPADAVMMRRQAAATCTAAALLAARASEQVTV